MTTYIKFFITVLNYNTQLAIFRLVYPLKFKKFKMIDSKLLKNVIIVKFLKSREDELIFADAFHYRNL
jgi:hypothetical protein